MPTRTGRPGKYDPLLRWLQALPSEQEHVILSLGHIADILGSPLPTDAATLRFWCARSTARQYWLTVGFSAKLSRFDRYVTFTRVQV